MSAVVLADVAAQIRSEHALAIQRATDALGHARITGELLVMARDAVPAGQWQAWIARECPDISARTVRRYMQLAREWPRVATATTVRAALAALAPPGPDSAPVGELVQPPENSIVERLSLPLPVEMRVAVEPGHVTLGVLDGDLALMVTESQRHRGYWYVCDLTDDNYCTRPIRADAVGILTAQHARWRDVEWHLAPQDTWFPEAA
jgi:hypothetical protein